MTILITAPAFAVDAVTEAEMRARLCARLKTKVVLGGMGRADCVSDTHAVEVGWADNPDVRPLLTVQLHRLSLQL